MFDDGLFPTLHVDGVKRAHAASSLPFQGRGKSGASGLAGRLVQLCQLGSELHVLQNVGHMPHFCRSRPAGLTFGTVRPTAAFTTKQTTTKASYVVTS